MNLDSNLPENNNTFDGAPWRFQSEASAEERSIQEGFVASLNQKTGFEIAGGGYLSPKAYWMAETLTLGGDCLAAAGARIDGQVIAGRNCSFNLNCTVAGKVTMGDNVRIAAGAGIWGFNHGFADHEKLIADQGVVTLGITLGDDIWIGANAVVTDGVAIGSHSIVAAGAVVTRDVPAYAIVAGNPARVLRDRRGAQPTELESLRSSLNALSEMAARDWKRVLEHHRSSDRAPYRYSDPRNNATDPVRPDCDAIQIATMFGEIPDGYSREDWISHLAGHQDPVSGLFVQPPGSRLHEADPTLIPDQLQLYDMLCVTYALECLGAAPKHRVHWADEVLANVESHLTKLPWDTRGWHCGGVIDHLGTAAYVNARYFNGQPMLDSLFGALLRRCDPQTGLWSPEMQDDLLEAVNGFYRLTRGTFAQFGLPVPYPEHVIDTVISYTRAHHHFSGYDRTACNVLDVVHPLLLAARFSQHRHVDLDATLLGVARSIDAKWQDGRGFAFCDAEEPSLQGTEMWLSIAALIAMHFGMSDDLSFKLVGIHRFSPGFDLWSGKAPLTQ